MVLIEDLSRSIWFPYFIFSTVKYVRIYILLERNASNIMTQFLTAFDWRLDRTEGQSVPEVVHWILVQALTVSQTSCVTLDKWLKLSEIQFSIYKMVDNINNFWNMACMIKEIRVDDQDNLLCFKFYGWRPIITTTTLPCTLSVEKWTLTHYYVPRILYSASADRDWAR